MENQNNTGTAQVNYLYVIPDSHRWHNLESLLNYLKYEKGKYRHKDDLIDYLIIGLTNTLSDGYDLRVEGTNNSSNY